MHIHKEGIRIIIICFFILLLVISGICILFPSCHIFKIIISGICFSIFLLIIRFFRNPNRTIQANNNLIVAPADGTIVAIEETNEDEYFKEKRIQVSIFMSIYNIHVNRYPVSGKIVYNKYHPGKYIVAKKPKSSLDNERSTIVLKSEKGQTVLVRQIAGAIARRIISYAQPDLVVNQGDDLGFIRFGSRVDMFLPLDVKINVKLGDKVKGNKTIIAGF